MNRPYIVYMNSTVILSKHMTKTKALEQIKVLTDRGIHASLAYELNTDKKDK